MGDPLSDFLRREKQAFGDYNGSTHVRLTGGSYIIDTDRVCQLYQFLQEHSDEPFALAECRMQETVLTIDVDYRAERTSDQLYQIDTHVFPIHREVVRLLRESVIGGVLDEDLSFVLLEKLDPNTGTVLEPQSCNDDRNVKQGFHMQYTKILANTRALTEYIIKPLYELFVDVDVSSCNNAWLMYGATKSGTHFPPPYTVTGYYNVYERSMRLADAYETYAFPENSVCAPCDNDTFETKVRKLLSVRQQGRTRYKRRLQETTPMPLSQNMFVHTHDYIQTATTVGATRRTFRDIVKLEHITQLVEMLPDTLAYDRDIWLKLGFCLWQITNATEDGLKLWLAFSAKCPEKFSVHECEDMWDRQMRPNAYTVGTLKYIAKKYNPEEYREWATKLSFNGEELKLTHVSMARIMHNELGTDYVCGHIKHDLWYKFDDVVWNEKGANILRSIISDENGPINVVLNRHLSAENAMMSDELEGAMDHKTFEKRSEAICKAILNLGNCSYKNSVMRECAEMFYNEDFVHQLDTNPYIIAFKNGVYDFKQCKFRCGEMEDMLSRMLPVKYVDYGAQFTLPSVDMFRQSNGLVNVCPLLKNIALTSGIDQSLKDVIDYFENTFPDTTVREYFLRQVCKVFVGGNQEKVCLFWTGNGNNGKTVTQTLFERMLGKYAVKMSTTVITGKKPCSAVANPELARLGNGVRWAVVEEPNNDEIINPGTLKSLTGNDTFFARDLYCAGKDTCEITPMFKLHCICNTLPAMRQADMATWNRVRVVPFEAIFVNEERFNREHDENNYLRLGDARFNDRIPHMIEPLAWLMVYMWNITRGEPADVYVDPDKVTSATNDYERENNHMRMFIETMLIRDTNASVSHNDLTDAFTQWLNATVPEVKSGNPRYLGKSRILSEFFVYTNCKKDGHIIKGYGLRDTTAYIE
ncbi:D5 family NTPase [European chub iridovirus]|nr:D5 family NTPase [European chub iridovirus]